VIPVAEGIARTQRQKLVAPLKKAFYGTTGTLSCFRIQELFQRRQQLDPIRRQCALSIAGHRAGRAIKIEVALREPLLTPGRQRLAKRRPLGRVLGRRDDMLSGVELESGGRFSGEQPCSAHINSAATE